MKERVTLQNLRLTNCFLNFELNILLHIRIKDSGKVWVVCFEPIGRANHRQPVGNKKKIPVHGKKAAVLVDVIQLVNPPEQLVFCSFCHLRTGTHQLG